MSEPARQPSGQPNGGQFATQVRAEPLRMWDPREGTFEHPPMPYKADDLIAFWRSVEVPDAILTNVRRAYLEMYDRERAAVARDFNVHDVKPSRDGRKMQEWQARRKAYLNQKMKSWPPEIPAALARSLVRVTKMWEYSRYLQDPNDRETVLNLKVQLPLQPYATIQQIVGRYRSHKLLEFMSDPDSERLRLIAAATAQAVLDHAAE